MAASRRENFKASMLNGVVLPVQLMPGPGLRVPEIDLGDVVEIDVDGPTALGGAGGNVIERHDGYLKWANDSWTLLPLTTGHLVLGPLCRVITAELDERVIALEAAVEALRMQIERWSRPGAFVVPDTSLFIEHIDLIDAMDLRPLLGIRDQV